MISTFQYLCHYYLLLIASDMQGPLEMADDERGGPPGEHGGPPGECDACSGGKHQCKINL